MRALLFAVVAGLCAPAVGAAKASDLPYRIDAGGLVPSPGMVRHSRGFTLAVEGADTDKCVMFRLTNEATVQVELTGGASYFDLVLYGIRGNDRVHADNHGIARGHAEWVPVREKIAHSDRFPKSITRTLAAGSYDACADPAGSATGDGDWVLDIRVLEDADQMRP